MSVHYYMLGIHDWHKRGMLCEEDDLRGVSEYQPYGTDPIENWPVPWPSFRAEGPAVTDYPMCIVGGWELVSERVRDCLLRLGVSGVDFHPVHITHSKIGTEIGPYYLMHVRNVVPALDREHAEWDPDPDDPQTVMSVCRYALRGEALDGAEVFKVEEGDGGSIPVFVSPRVHHALLALAASGFEFHPVPVYGEVKSQSGSTMNAAGAIADDELSGSSEAAERFAPNWLIEMLQPGSVQQAMDRLVERCASRSPDPLWQDVRALPYEKETESLSQWFTNILETEPPESSVAAFWFGLFNPVAPDGVETLDFYVTGSTWYSEDDDDWACWRDDSWVPEGRYARLSLLDRLHRIGRRLDVEARETLENILILGYVACAVDRIFRSTDPQLVLKGSSGRYVAVGYDNGDCMTIGRISVAGWETGIRGCD